MEESLSFWKEKVGMTSKGVKEAGAFKIHKVGFADQDFSFELVPLELMNNNPNNLNLGTPSICFSSPNLTELRNTLLNKGVQVTEIVNHFGPNSFAFSDNHGNWFAAMQE